MIPSAKEKIEKVVEMTQESIQGIGEGVKHGAAVLTGASLAAGDRASAGTESFIQRSSQEIPRETGALHEYTKSSSASVNQGVEDVKKKGLGTKISELAGEAKENIQGNVEGFTQGFKSDVHESRKKSSS